MQLTAMIDLSSGGPTPEQKKCVEENLKKLVEENPQLNWWWEDIGRTHDRLVAAGKKCQELPAGEEQEYVRQISCTHHLPSWHSIHFEINAMEWSRTRIMFNSFQFLHHYNPMLILPSKCRKDVKRSARKEIVRLIKALPKVNMIMICEENYEKFTQNMEHSQKDRPILGKIKKAIVECLKN